jgi:hypothetical protein
MTRLVDLNELDALAGEWRSVHNLLMEAAVKARVDEAYGLERPAQALNYAEACEAVATRLASSRRNEGVGWTPNPNATFPAPPDRP